MSHRGLALIGAALILNLTAQARAGAVDRPLYTIASTAQAPRIDGRLDDPCWQQATRIGPFILLGTSQAPTQETRAWATYDDRTLFIAFECLEERTADLAARHSARDSDVWQDDCVEIFLDPGRSGGRYFHLVVNSLGAQYDEREARIPAAWDGEWQAAADRSADRWMVEVAIPFASLGLSAPQLLDAWRFNLARHETPRRELSEIAPTAGTFHDPARFAELVFGGAEPVAASVISTGGPFLGRREAQVRIVNFGARPARVSMWATVSGARQQRVAAQVAPLDSRVVSVPYEVYLEGEATLSLNAADPAGRSLLRSTPLAFRIEAVQERLKQVLAGLDRVSGAAQSRGLGRDLDRARAEAQRLLGIARDRRRWADGDRAEWERLAAVARRVDVTANRLRLRALSADPGAGYAVGVESPLRKLRPDEPYRGMVGAPAEVWLARNEYEPVQVVVLALEKPLEGVRVYATDLVGPGGARIRDHNVTLNLVGFVHTRRPAYAVDYVGWYPDPLLEVVPFDVPADGLQPLWVTVYCPASVPGGDYSGEVVVKPDNAPEVRVALVAHVWDFALPEETHLKTAFAFSASAVAAWYGYDQVPPEVLVRWYDFLLRRRINPTNVYSSTPVPDAAHIAFCLKRGMNAFNLGYVSYPSSAAERQARVEAIRRYAEFLKQQGWFRGAYVYGFDEIGPPDYPKLREMYAMIGQAVPDLPRACTVAPNEELSGYVDIWVPLTAAYDHATAQRYRAQGDEVWWYVCCGPHHPYANWFIDYPATDARLLFWMNWKYGVNGFLYYNLNRWHSNLRVEPPPQDLIPPEDPAVCAAIAAGRRWPQVPWNTFTYRNFNGDGQLIYPGPGANPWSSVRLECIRDGIEDYEYFYLLSQLTAALEGPERYHVIVKKAKALLAVEPLCVKSLTEYTDDPDVVERARRALGEHLEIMWRAAHK